MWIAKDNDGTINLWVERPYKTIYGYWRTYGVDSYKPIIDCFETRELYQQFKDMSADELIEVGIEPITDCNQQLKLKSY